MGHIMGNDTGKRGESLYRYILAVDILIYWNYNRSTMLYFNNQ